MPRTFSPGLSSIGAAGFKAVRNRQVDEAMGVNDFRAEEEKRMVNTFGSNIGGNGAAGPGMNYPFSEDGESGSKDLRSTGKQVRIVGVQNYPEGSEMFRTYERDNDSELGRMAA